MKKVKKLFIGVLIIIGIISIVENLKQEDKKEVKETTAATNNQEKKQEEDKKEKTVSKKEKPKLSQEDIIKKNIKAIVKEQNSSIKIKEIKVNKNYGLNDGSYIVLPYLKWDAANTAKTTKKLLDMYSEDLAAKLAKETKISEITVFWEAPYLAESKNIAKYTYSRSEKDMVKEETWYDPWTKMKQP
ncbi:hypothetical protein WD019_03230 [Fictibacillus sp. Mic-4]|uniref:hypothetical protein n=1 Tax=Fictibacillus sp. Mic-4 TaxID=3132826 RepID=UPI003CF5053B